MLSEVPSLASAPGWMIPPGLGARTMSQPEAVTLAGGAGWAAEPPWCHPQLSSAHGWWGLPHPPAPCGSLCCFTENVMTRQPLSFQAGFQLLGGETFCSCFWVWHSRRLCCRGDQRGDLASPAEGGLPPCPCLRWHGGTGVAAGRAAPKRNKQLLLSSMGGC